MVLTMFTLLYNDRPSPELVLPLLKLYTLNRHYPLPPSAKPLTEPFHAPFFINVTNPSKSHNWNYMTPIFICIWFLSHRTMSLRFLYVQHFFSILRVNNIPTLCRCNLAGLRIKSRAFALSCMLSPF